MELTKNEKIIKSAALVYAITFIGAVGVFVFLPDFLFIAINSLSDMIFGAGTLPHYPLGENKFWLTMTVSMMSGVTITSLLIWKDVKSNLNMAIPLFTMKFVSSIGGLLFFLAGFIVVIPKWTAFANLVIFITDFPLGLFMLVMYKKISTERNGSF